MAAAFSFPFPPLPAPHNFPRPSLPPARITFLRQNPPPLHFSAQHNNASPSENPAEKKEQAEATKQEDIGEVIKQEERSKIGEVFGGVAEEVREIEWPEFGKVVGTTGVVLAVIAGSSVALLTVNAILAEFSDRVFAGKGVQDFFLG